MFFGRKSAVTQPISSFTSVSITDAGKKTAERELAQGATYAILSVLDDHSPRTVGSIAHETQIDINEVKERVKMLARQGYVRLTSAESM